MSAAKGNPQLVIDPPTGASAQLAIDPPALLAGLRAPTPCRILDAHLRPIASTIADGALRQVPAGLIVLIITTPGGGARRRVLRLDQGGEYRLHYFRGVAEEFAPQAESLADPEALRVMAYLQSGQVRQARTLCDARLELLRHGELGDPVAAAAVGYVLLQTSEHEALDPWCFYLSLEYPGLADGYVIAAEWHAEHGNNLTALNYLRQLDRRRLPIFSIGLSRALDRLAVLRAQETAMAKKDVDSTEEEETIDQAQVLNPWDVDDAAEIRDRLAGRASHVNVWAPTTAPNGHIGFPPRRSRVGDITRALAGPVAEAAAGRARRARGHTRGVEGMTDENAEARDKRTGISGVPMYVAIGAIVIWVAFAVVMLFLSNTSDVRWTRIAYVFGSVEAIAFAAAGALFGVTVQRERVQRAEEKADENEQDAASGRALATINMADGGRVVEQDGESTFEAFGPQDAADAEIRRRHAEAARRLFPNL